MVAKAMTEVVKPGPNSEVVAVPYFIQLETTNG